MFPLGRASWLFLTGLALRLVERGELELDAPVLEYLPDVDVMDLTREVTVRHIMSETSGLNSFRWSYEYTAALETGRMERGDALNYVGARSFKPGTRAEYSFTNGYLLVLLVEAVTGQSATDAIHAEFIDPLGLSETLPLFEANENDKLANGYEIGEDGQLTPAVFADYRKSVAAESTELGLLASPINDITSFGHDLIAGDILQPTTRDELRAVVAEGHNWPWGRCGFGLGVFRTEAFEAGPAIGYATFSPGYVFNLFHFPEHGFTVAVATNAVGGPGVKPELIVAPLALEAARISSGGSPD